MAWKRPLWWILLIGSLGTDLATQAFSSGLLGPGLYMALWFLAFLACPDVTVRAAGMSFVPWLYPLAAAASILTSQDPLLSLKAVVYVCITVTAAMLMARRLPPRDVILVMLIVTLIGGIASLAVGTRRDALIGVYGSKNSLAFYAGLLLLSGTAILLDRQQLRSIRLMGLLGVVLAPVLLLQGQSTGALIGGVAALGMLLVAFVISLLPQRLRSVYLFCCVSVGVVAGVCLGVIVAGDEALLLEMVGKRGDLTGRAYLWQRATELSEQRPWLGYGLSAFWVQGSVEAEGLWRVNRVIARSGFHFHNLYYQTLVETGLVGLISFVITLVLLAGATLRWAIKRPGIESSFFLSLLTYIYLRTPTEVEVGGPFGLHCMIFFAVWVYATQYESLAKGWQPERRPGIGRARQSPFSRQQKHEALPRGA